MERKLYFRLFLYTFAAVFAAGLALTWAYSRDFWEAAGGSAFYALFFGALVSLAGGKMHSMAVRNVPGWRDEDFVSLRREREFRMNVPPGQAHDLALRFLTEQAGLVLEFNDREKGLIIARAPMSLHSFGITVKMDIRDDAGRAAANLLVKPVVGLSLIDNGATLSLANKIERGLSGSV
ncbi:MAG: hypothetical protein RQ748_08230 [Elusimicrobiales bacterium]|nr:hypothetical protein [Elusimicrobiales bacterium]